MTTDEELRLIDNQEALEFLTKAFDNDCGNCEECLVNKLCHTYEAIQTLQELINKYNAIQYVYFKNEPMESADLTAIKLQELYNCISKLIEKNQKLKETVDDKETPKKPVIRGLSVDTHTAIHTCPACNKELIMTNGEIVIYKTKTNYCDECGQKLDWSDE